MKEYRKAIVTVTDTNFLPGTYTLIYSIIKCNPWFKGDFIIIHDDLKSQEMDILKSISPRITFLNPSNNLLTQIRILDEYFPFSNKDFLRSFFSLESFRLTSYDQVLYLDSDTFCRASIEPIYACSTNGLAVGLDGPTYEGFVRDPDTYLPIKKRGIKEPLIGFNSGVMLINNSNLGSKTYFNLLKLLKPENYASLKIDHTDQFVLNKYFHGNFETISPKYNFLLHAKASIKSHSNIVVEDSVLVHFSRISKPWEKKKKSYIYSEWHRLYEEALKVK